MALCVGERQGLCSVCRRGTLRGWKAGALFSLSSWMECWRRRSARIVMDTYRALHKVRIYDAIFWRWCDESVTWVSIAESDVIIYLPNTAVNKEHYKTAQLRCGVSFKRKNIWTLFLEMTWREWDWSFNCRECPQDRVIFIPCNDKPGCPQGRAIKNTHSLQW